MDSAHCIFCVPKPESVLRRTPLVYAFWDAYPVTPLHALIIPNRHIATVFEMTSDELDASMALIQDVRELILAKDPAVTGFNVGTNAGVSAGQTILHAHIHLIPRRSGDVPCPRGGVRHVIPGKGSY